MLGNVFGEKYKKYALEKYKVWSFDACMLCYVMLCSATGKKDILPAK
jgi:hypothetical protein